MRCETRVVSHLSKVFPDEAPRQAEFTLSCLLCDAAAFQVACYLEAERSIWAEVELQSTLAPWITLYNVMLSPSAYPAHPKVDSGYLRTTPGLYPDRLALQEKGSRPGNGLVRLCANQWRAIWVQIDTDENTPPGLHAITLIGRGEEGNMGFTETLEIEVLPVELPKGKTYHTQWFHSDCLADHYGVEPLSDAHFSIMEAFVALAAKRGINTLLTPLFTPPLDTKVGGQRTTVQLVGVTRDEGIYRFDFTLLRRYVDMVLRCGIEYFEMSHLFTQWGAKHAPKIMVSEAGECRQLFGWDTDATGDAYANFLHSFLPALVGELRTLGIAERCFFHISDEPHGSQLPQYMAAKNLVAPYLKGFTIMDALSDIALYEQGAVAHPIPANNAIEPFLEKNIPGLWTYYCTSQWNQVSNRFFSMPSSRNRILGVQLYKYDVKGFLHWGYNFYNDAYSIHHINPYAVTDAGEAFPSGDPFLVYPGKDGKPEPSIRMMVLQQAFHDIRALSLLEEKAGRETVLALIEEGLTEPLTFTKYPLEEEYLLRLREKVNARISQL